MFHPLFRTKTKIHRVRMLRFRVQNICREKASKPQMRFGIKKLKLLKLTNKFDFFPNTFKPEEDKNGNGIHPGEDFYSITDGVIDYTKTNGILDGPDQDRGALEGAIWAIMPLCIIYYSFLQLGWQSPSTVWARNRYCLCSCLMCLFNLGISLGLTPLGEQLRKCCFKFCFHSTMGK